MATKAPTKKPAKKPAKKPTSAKASGNGYDADAIQTLEGLEAVRKRPGMYIGGTGSQGLMHLVWELIDNAVDEAAAGHATRIDVTLHRDQTVEVADNGRGIPIDEHAKRKVSALEVVFTELHAGGKFGGGAYGASGGLHGVGASVVNALSSRLIAQVDREGHTWELAFRNRVAGHVDAKTRKFRAGHELHKVKKIAKTKTGTRVRFLPDRELFDADAGIDFDEICDRVTRSCYLVPGLKVRVHDKRTGGRKEPFEFVSRGGLTDLVDSHSEGDRASEVISLSGIETFTERVPVDGKMRDVERECTVQVAMRWVKGFDSSFHSFVNTIPTDQGGTHVTGFERALTRAVNDVLLKDARKLAKLAKANKHRATKDDIQEGLVAAIKIEFPEPQFRGQTKQELGTPAVEKIVYDIVKSGLADWFGGSGPKTHINAVREKIATAIVNRVASKQVLENRRKAASMGSTGMPDKLADCRVHGPDAELVIVEGDSAAGPAKMGRNSENTAILPLRGKVVNAGKATLKQVLDNAEAQSLFTAIGAGQGKDFDLDSVRYGRIIILCDADVDGSHIRCLLLTLIHEYMQPLLEAGRVYAAQPPLYSCRVGDTLHRAFTEEERDAITAELTKGRRKATNLTWNRFKGLGEMNVDELAECALDRDSRVLRRLTMEDARQAKDAARLFDVLMGSDVAQRREYLIKNSALLDPGTLDI
ncbi:MAG: ATP-binding protein [Acidimicrobiales bacterium]|nr:ATP-binding protein [Acidimicrobiales bacterium]MDP7125126.1 ATP-binding protein [Acidimicrobiales bacterium]MDP7351967.1 ATP-binding protein [Acidimicrobiales bacterium]